MDLQELAHLLHCPECSGGLHADGPAMLCGSCGKTAAISGGVLDFDPKLSSPPYYDREHGEAAAKIAELHALYYRKGSASGALESMFKQWFADFIGETGPVVFDVGCGRAGFFEHLPPETTKIGIDVNADLLASASQSHPHAWFLRCDLLHSPLRPGVVDQAISMFTLEHVFELEGMLEAMTGLLSDEGRFHVAIPTEGGLLWTMLREAAHFSYARKLGINYRRFARKEHVNSADYVDAAIRKHFQVLRKRYAPFRMPTKHLNCAVFYELRKL